MKSAFLISFCLLLSFPVFAEEATKLVASIQQHIEQFNDRFKTELQYRLKYENLPQTILQCKTFLTQVAVETNLPWQINRISMNALNAANKPDPWELSVLESFEARKQQGEAIASLNYFEIVTQQGQRFFRYMQAIPMQAICLNCHGEDIQQDITAKMQQLYPNDHFSRFSLEDIRGAYSVTQPWD